MVEEDQNVAEEIQQEVVHPTEDPSPEPQAEAEHESDKDRNFRELRESKRQLEREMRMMKERLDAMSQPQSKPAEDYEISDDDLVEGKHLKRYIQRLESQIASQQSAAVPDRLRSKFTDFDSVVTQENVEKLKQTEPELYSSIVSGSDLYAKGVSAYKAIKSFGIAKEDQYASEKERVKKVHDKPMSAQAVKAPGVVHEANLFAKGLTPELRKQLFQEMVEAAKAR